jgi:glycosyltransferase involved in cell wall biosynthesis
MTTGRLRIAQVAPLYERVPPRLYGGTERVVSYLTEELVRRGHDVTLFASGESETKAKLIAPVPTALRLASDASQAIDAASAHVLEIGQVFDRAREFDIIHCHVDYPAFLLGRAVPTPVLHTLHGRLDLPYLRPVFGHFSDAHVVSISDAQRTPLAGFDVRWAGTVYHGLPLELYPYSPTGGNYLAFLGRIAPEKRLDLAVAVARRVGIPLRIAAKVDAADRAYFERDIRPLLHDPLVEFIGEIGDAEKPAFLGGAMALVFPIDWPEPFGLVMVEAMACGTPVIARSCGSVPEVIAPGHTGFVVDSVGDMVEAVKRIDVIDRADCRRWVEQRFSVERMVDGYEQVYAELQRGRRVSNAAQKGPAERNGRHACHEFARLTPRDWPVNTLSRS